MRRQASKRFFLAVFGLLGVCHAQPDPTSSPETCAIDPKAIVSDACASYSTLDKLNTELQPTIRSLTHDSDFFSYYRLNLYNKVCPFWSDESGLCGNIACAVNTIDNEDDIPLIWRAEELGKLEGPKAQHPTRQLQKEAKPLMGGLGDDVGESCVVEYDDECDERDYCVPEDESATAKGDYVSLVDNPERFTGYSGPSAHQVWEAIYRENCFPRESDNLKLLAPPSPLGMPNYQRQAAQDLRSVIRSHERHQNLVSGVPGRDDFQIEEGEQCLEKRVFHRVISGMHASISTHLCYDYLNQTTGQWGPNLSCYISRLHNYPDRISNLYFNYALVLRAISKLKPSLSGYTFCSGDPTQDSLTKNKILALAAQIDDGTQIYDESLMFRDPTIGGLKDDFRNRFRNVSRTMDCVGCDKCRLWGKLQTAGYGTALKILFEFGQGGEDGDPPLRRTELVALVNTLDKLSHSLTALGKFQEMLPTSPTKEFTRDATPQRGLPRTDDTAAPLTDTPNSADPANTFPFTSPSPNNAEHPSPKSNSNSASTSTSEDEEELDTDLYPPTQNQPPSPATSELLLIWNTTKWVLRSWIDLPRNLLYILVMELSRLWDFWLGREDGARRVWEIRLPEGVVRRGERGEKGRGDVGPGVGAGGGIGGRVRGEL